MVNIFYNVIFLLLESCFVIFLKEKENTYEKTYKLYYLSLKDPDIVYAKNILRDLEKKSRNIMKFYQSNLFEKSNINTSISAIFENLSSLYPNKDIKTEQIIDKQLLNEKNNRSMKLISVITKELVNNVYKHSDATYLIYMLFKEGDSVIIEINSDGANIEDFKNIKESRRGVLLLNLLIDSNSGNIEYKLNDNVLSTRVVLE